VNLKSFPLFLLITIIVLFPASLLSQKVKSNTVVKAAFEGGHVDLYHSFGDGSVYRGILRVQSTINFSRAFVSLKGYFAKEYFNTLQSVNAVNQQGDLVYVKYFTNSSFQFNASFNNHSSLIDTFEIQDVNEWQAAALYNIAISKNFSLLTRNTYLSRNFSFHDTKYSKNKLLLSLSANSLKNNILSAGLFWENIDLDNVDTVAVKDLFGFQLEYQYSKLLILNLSYDFSFIPDQDYKNHQLYLIAGKYLTKKCSVFLSMFYTWVMDDEDYLELFNRVEIFNNINIRLGYDLFANTNIYFKGILEDHKLVNYSETISSKQIVAGIQQKF
jgi:hypothetical protein